MSAPTWRIRTSRKLGATPGDPVLWHIEADTSHTPFYGIDCRGADVWGCGITRQQAVENFMQSAKAVLSDAALEALAAALEVGDNHPVANRPEPKETP